MRLAHVNVSSMNGSAVIPANDNGTFSNNVELVRSKSAFAAANADPSSGFRFMENGGRPFDKSKPLKFTEAVRIHESLSAHNVSL